MWNSKKNHEIGKKHEIGKNHEIGKHHMGKNKWVLGFFSKIYDFIVDCFYLK